MLFPTQLHPKLAIFNWSGGKDSALALFHTLQDPNIEVAGLLTTINAEVNRISMHGVHQNLLQRQVEAIGLPLSVLSIPGEITMPDYDRLMAGKLEEIIKTGVTHSIFGDIFLEDLRDYRVKKLEEVGLKAIFPLWGKNTSELVNEFVELGFKTMVVSVDGSKLDQSFAGRIIDKEFLKELPKNVDPCGENGEFHSFVFDGPIFNMPVPFTKGEVVPKEYVLSKETGETVTYWFQDLQ